LELAEVLESAELAEVLKLAEVAEVLTLAEVLGSAETMVFVSKSGLIMFLALCFYVKLRLNIGYVFVYVYGGVPG